MLNAELGLKAQRSHKRGASNVDCEDLGDESLGLYGDGS